MNARFMGCSQRCFVGVPVAIGAGLAAAYVVAQRSLWSGEIGIYLSQPVAFSHAHHVGELGTDCRYCHTSFDESPFAGMPTAETCMNCHSQLYTDSGMLAPVRESWRTGTPIAWRRVNQVPDFAFFNHEVHVAADVLCITCHGDVASMPLTVKSDPLTMRWCLDCHRDPHGESVASSVVPTLETGANEPGPIDAEVLTSCSACHR